MEITLYDTNGDARAYIYNDKFGTIWTWDGHAVAYITRETIYGWRGHHIGWFVGDVVYDTHGYQVGFTRRRCPVSIHSEPPKAPKHASFCRRGAFRITDDVGND